MRDDAIECERRQPKRCLQRTESEHLAHEAGISRDKARAVLDVLNPLNAQDRAVLEVLNGREVPSVNNIVIKMDDEGTAGEDLVEVGLSPGSARQTAEQAERLTALSSVDRGQPAIIGCSTHLLYQDQPCGKNFE